jgi:hypothetical protein
MLIAALVLATPVVGQDAEWREVDNPYQEDLPFSLGEPILPRIDVDGIRWHSLVVEGPSTGLIAAEQDVDVEVRLDVENRTNSGAKLLIILLLENADGEPLGRIELRQFKVGGEKRKERSESSRMASEILRQAESVYLFFEILE